MTFKELKIGDFFILSKNSKLYSKFGTVLIKKTGEKEIRSMSSGADFPVHDNGIIKPDEVVIKVVLKKYILETYG